MVVIVRPAWYVWHLKFATSKAFDCDDSVALMYNFVNAPASDVQFCALLLSEKKCSCLRCVKFYLFRHCFQLNENRLHIESRCYCHDRQNKQYLLCRAWDNASRTRENKSSVSDRILFKCVTLLFVVFARISCAPAHCTWTLQAAGLFFKRYTVNLAPHKLH